jgi:hypothetical protein
MILGRRNGAHSQRDERHRRDARGGDGEVSRCLGGRGLRARPEVGEHCKQYCYQNHKAEIEYRSLYQSHVRLFGMWALVLRNFCDMRSLPQLPRGRRALAATRRPDQTGTSLTAQCRAADGSAFDRWSRPLYDGNYLWLEHGSSQSPQHANPSLPRRPEV